MEIRISTTATLHGFGSSKWKHVRDLTSDERKFIRSGGVVLIEYTPTSHMQSGWKQCYAFYDKFHHREATPEQIEAAKALNMNQ